MALSNDEKLETVRSAFKKKLYEIETWADFKTLLNNITKIQIKNFIRNNLQAEANKRRTYSINENSHADDLENLKTEI